MNRVDIVKAKYPKFVDVALSVEDPTKTNKYLLWIAAQLSRGHSISDIKGTVDFFHKYNTKFKEKDIYKYEDLKTLEDICKEMPERSKRQIREDLKEYGAEKIFENDLLKVIRVDTKAAMILYGANTRWCTVSKDSTHYEEYVRNGNDFYITTFKGKSPLDSDKYAVVRRDLLSFEIFAANDVNMRSFKPNEREILHDVVAAVAADKPKDNMLRVILKNKSHIEKIQGLNEWLAAQIPSTMKYLAAKVPNFEDISILKAGNDGQALMDFIIATNPLKIEKLNIVQRKAIAEFLEAWNNEGNTKSNPKVNNWDGTSVRKRGRQAAFKKGTYSVVSNVATYTTLSKFFSRDFLLRMRNSSGFKLREIAANGLSEIDDLKPLLDDSSSTVVKAVIQRLSKKQLIDLQRDNISEVSKKVIISELEKSITTDSLCKTLLKRPQDEIMKLVFEHMISSIASSKDGMKFLLGKISDDERTQLFPED